MNFVTHLECANCGKRYEANLVHNLCTACQRPLWVKYDLEALKTKFPKKALLGRPSTMWRYLEMLPIQDPDKIVSLTETTTPILQTKRLAASFGLDNLFVKDESRLPTGSFKSRGMTMAISKANEFGIKKVAVPTAGNAGGAMAAYAARAGMEAYVFMPEDTPAINKKECYLAGAKTFLVNGLITDCGRIVGEGKQIKNWFDVSTLKEPYRIEGKKTMGLELAEQFDWELPDVILYPTGGGTGLIGMWKAFAELEAMGWLKTSKKPKMISCQSEGCAPISTAFEKGERFAPKFENASTIASGIRVPAAVGDFMILDAVRQSGGVALATPEADIPKWMQLAASMEGIALCPETAVCLGALEVLLKRGTIKNTDRILIFNTGASQKYPEAVNEQLSRIDIKKPIDWAQI
ncbi:threonine synthase [Pedosphaera parvula]|uniref:Threonine synthase n=1 Tax=Pedosphaera parvula (strain Ellin514) TaxID=320771 RepID=B9XM73_PEDPL|nr:threonine synthase [Pedosphaera parvula]EEF59066.1 threonine synthase [Pedosphaera parvula Ellin514]